MPAAGAPTAAAPDGGGGSGGGGGGAGAADHEDASRAQLNNLPAHVLHAVFALLGPKDLCRVSAVCVLWRRLNRDGAANRVWQRFYRERWRVNEGAGAAASGVCWQSRYGAKMKLGKSWAGKYEADSLYGHKAGVKALKLLPSHGWLLTGSLDRTVRLWDLKYGMPLSIGASHGGTVRSVALDEQVVASGSSDNVVRLWHAGAGRGGEEGGDRGALLEAAPFGLGAARGDPPSGGGGGGEDDCPFDLALPAQQLRGHIGPVTSLALTDSCLYSGSWDYTVRCWRRGSWDCISVLKYSDWVYSVTSRGGLLLVASGPEVHVHDLATGKLLRKFENLHEGSVSCLEGSHSGHLLFSGGGDGLVMAHDLRMKEPSRVLFHHNAGVHALAMDCPWLVSAAADGTLVMHNTEAALPTSGGVGRGGRGAAAAAAAAAVLPSRRSLSCHGHSGPMYCVDISEGWLAAGGESPPVRTFDFTRAAEAAARAAAARAARNGAKRAAKQRKAAASAAAAAVRQGGGGRGGTADAALEAGGASLAGGSGSGRGPARGLLAAAAAAARPQAPSLQEPAVPAADRFHLIQRWPQQQQQHAAAGEPPAAPGAVPVPSPRQAGGGSGQARPRGSGGGGGQRSGRSPRSSGGCGSFGGSPRPFGSPQGSYYGSSPPPSWWGSSPPGGRRAQPGGHTHPPVPPAQQQRAGGVPIPGRQQQQQQRCAQPPPGADEGGVSCTVSPGLGAAAARVGAPQPPYRVPFSSSYPSAGHPGPWVASGSSPRFAPAGPGTAGAAAAGGSAAAASSLGVVGAGGGGPHAAGAGPAVAAGARSGARAVLPAGLDEAPGSISN